MAKNIFSMAALLLFTLNMAAKELQTVVFTTTPQMHCASCEKRIKENLRFEKGVKEIETSVPDQTVTIKFNADKTNPQQIAKGFKKIGYDVREVKKGEKVKASNSGTCNMK